ncbi:MAG: glycosyltransferase 87 family protein [archaeon]|nr:glycosyltransferase 87 family protein [archaeon]
MTSDCVQTAPEEVVRPHGKLKFFSGLALLVTVLGFAIRLILAPYVTYPFDIEHWAVILQNTESGNGLFGLTGYFYTPVWGYILGFEDVVINSLFSVEYGRRALGLLGIENLEFVYYTATTTSPGFNLLMKVPLILVDFLVGYIVYRLVLSHSGDERKAAGAYGLWFLCPLVIYMSAVQAQFDCISALFMLLCVLLLRKDRCFLAGVMFALGSLIKFFPAFCILLLCMYIFKVHADPSARIRKFLLALVGALFTVALVFLPQILDGTVIDAFSFIFGRTSEFSLVSALRTYPVILVTLVLMVVLVLHMRRMGEQECRDRFITMVLLMLTICVMISSGPQYCIVYLPLLAYYIFAGGANRPLMWCFIIITVTSTVSAFFNNSLSILTTLVEYCGVWNADSLLSAMDVLETEILGLTLRALAVTVSELIQTIFMIVLILFIADDLGLLKRFGKLTHLSRRVRVKLGGVKIEEE